MNEDVLAVSKVKGPLCLLTIFLCIVLFVLPGCSKEKATGTEGKGPVGTCEIFDKLPKDVSKPIEINYANRIKLMGVTISKQSQNLLKISYYWEPLDELGAYNMVFVHFTDNNNKVLFQNDHPFCQNKALKALTGKVIKESYEVNIPKNGIGQESLVKMGLYDPKFSRRLRIESSGGIPTDDSNTRAIVEGIKLQ